MKRHRTIVWIFALMGALLVVPAAASASGPLLSGYGGPGAGEQVILGSQVIGGSSGGASSGGSSSIEAPSTESQADSSSEQASSSTVAQAPQTTSSPHADVAKGSLQTHIPTSSATARAQTRPHTPKASPEGSLPRSATVSQASYDTRIGLSSSDLLEVILVAGVLAVLALWTRRLARLQP